MAEKHKKQPAEFARDKNAFAGGNPREGEDAVKKTKQSGAHQPRDADISSGHSVQKSSRGETFGHGVQKSGGGETFGHDVQKPEHRQSFEQGGKKPEQRRKYGYGEKNPEQNEFSGHDARRPGQGQTFRHHVQKPGNDADAFLNSQRDFQGRKDKKEEKSRKARRQQKKYQKDNAPAEKIVNPDVGKPNQEGKKTGDFSPDKSGFTDEGEEGNAGFTEKDDYRRKDTYHQTEKKRRYRRRRQAEKYRKRERESRERTKQDDFRNDFQTKEYSLQRVFDEKTGTAKYVLAVSEKEKPFKVDNPVKMLAGKAVREPAVFTHGKVSEVEKENSAVEGAHKSEQKAEDVYHFVKRQYAGKAERQRRKVAKLEKKQFKREVNFRYQKFLEENPELQEKTLKKQLQKRLQKQRIKREYAKAAKAGKAAKNAKEATAKAADITTTVAKKLQELASKHAAVLVSIGAVAVLLIMIMTSVSSCGAMFSNGLGDTLAGSYMSAPAEIDAADLAFSELEVELQEEIDSIETDYPDYDEYRYNLDAIGHDPFALISYLSAVHTEFTAAAVQGEIESLFDEMYELTLNPTTETRTRTVTDPDTGEETEEEYTVSILEVTLTATDLGVIVSGRMTAEQREIYALYNQTHGLTQQFYTPLDLYWYNYVSSYYGYRVNPVTGARQLHRGVDIAVPTGTPVLAAMDGTVTTAAYDSSYGNYVVIEDSGGYCTKYAHMDTLSVSTGQTVTHGTVIGTTGNTGSSTGSHLHIECLYSGEYYNPLFYSEAGEGTLYGESPSPGSGGGGAVPPDSYDDAVVQTLMEEAARYLGYPYVWGGSSPSTSFDCSGFVCWVFMSSGVHDLPRTTAQGIYNQCTPVSAADAKAGDIIFFTGTYNSGTPVTHVGIYCGNGVMIHAGDPIKYSNINTSYWQSHFYSFGRLN